MSESTIIYPSCKTEIKLTESLAAPLLESICRNQVSAKAGQNPSTFSTTVP